MLGWLNGFLSWSFSGIDDVRNWVVNLFKTAFSYIDSGLKSAWNGILQAWNEAVNLYNQAIKYIVQLYNLIRYTLDIEIKAVETWVSSLYNYLRQQISGTIAWINGLISKIENWITSEINTLYQWVLRNIWNPLYNTIAGAINWISKYGYWVYYVITHPDVLASMIGTYVLREFFSLGHKYSRVIGRWLVHSMLSASHEVSNLIEDFISSII